MADTTTTPLAPRRSRASSSIIPVRATFALRALVRAQLAGGWAVRVARACAWLIALGVLACCAIVGRQSGPDADVLAIVARGAAAVTVVAGGLGALALSAEKKDDALRTGTVALARAHWLGDRAIARAELVATLRILAELIAVPIAAIAALVFAVIGRAYAGKWVYALLGTVAFSVLAALVLGSVAWACRRWGGPAGRRWFLTITLVPWILAEAGSWGTTGRWLSVPGALAELWQALTAVAS